MTKVTKVTKVKIKVKGQISGHNLIAPHIEVKSEYFIVLRSELKLKVKFEVKGHISCHNLVVPHNEAKREYFIVIRLESKSKMEL